MDLLEQMGRLALFEGVPAEKLRTQVLAVIAQIGIVDIIFSLDSVLTAIGLANHVGIMVAAIVCAVLVMMFMAGAIHEFIERHPTIKVLALSFLILVGIALVGEAFDMNVPKGYLYFAMAFSVCVEMVNIRVRKKGQGVPVELRERAIPGDE